MGTHIDCFISIDKKCSKDLIQKKLEKVFIKLSNEIEHLSKYGDFSQKIATKWEFQIITETNTENNYLTSENGSFIIDAYDKVISISNIERFSSLCNAEKNISKELIKIIKEINTELGNSQRILIGKGGFGDTDVINDLASENLEFEKLVNYMLKEYGKPAKLFDELNEKIWILSDLSI